MFNNIPRTGDDLNWFPDVIHDVWNTIHTCTNLPYLVSTHFYFLTDFVDGSDLSLDCYLANHTSEDNAAFRDMISDLEVRRRTRMAWCYEAEERAKKAIEPSKGPVVLAIQAGKLKLTKLLLLFKSQIDLD